MRTEDEAKTRTCPLAMPSVVYCTGMFCMAWQWDPVTANFKDREGRCGLIPGDDKEVVRRMTKRKRDAA